MTTPRIRFWPVTTSFRQQQGFATLLIVLLTGLSLTAITMGVMHYIRGAQDSQMSVHAQTQAEIQAMTGTQALAAFLRDKTLATVSSIHNGTITPPNGNAISYTSTTNCPASGDTTNPNYCFDVTGHSGNAYATLRSVFSGVKSLTSSSLAGSVFASGLRVDGSATLQGDGANVAIQVGGAGYPVDNHGNPISLPGITSSPYSHTQFMQPNDLRPYANYIYYASGTTAVCKKNNLPSISSETDCNATELAYASYTSSSKTWSINTNKLPVGALWFDGNLTVNYAKNVDLVNTIISTGSITTALPNGFQGTLNSYAPNFYHTYVTPDSPEKTCGVTNYPTQLCSSGAFKDVTQFPASLANILFLSADSLTLDGSNNITTNYYGNLISATGNGGTGSPSGKFTGTGTIKITGNIVNSSEDTTNPTVLLGNITITLANTTSGDTYIPSYTYVYSLKYMRYL